MRNILIFLLLTSLGTVKTGTVLTGTVNLSSKTRVSKMSLVGTALAGTLKFGFNNFDKILSKKFAAALIIAGGPYLYFTDTDVLAILSRCAADFAFKMSGSIADGTLQAIVNNPMALSKIIATLTIGSAGKELVGIVGKELAKVAITVITLGAL